jgi:hypothetical protein
MIPEEKNAAVARALQEAFGVTGFEDIRRMTAGLGSDLVFRIVVRGAPSLLRIMPRIDERMDPGRIFACMSTAASAGLTPSVRYSNAEDGISITDFVKTVPFPETQALIQLPDTLRRLHALPPFPKAFNYVTAHNGFIWRFRKASLLPQGEIEEVFARYEQVCATYPRLDSDMVSCHMDLKPENILFDGQHVWLAEMASCFCERPLLRFGRRGELPGYRRCRRTRVSRAIFWPTSQRVPTREILPYASGGAHVLRHGFPVAGFRGQADRPKREAPLFQRLSSAVMGRRGQPGGQRSEDRLWPGSLGTPLAENAATTI